MLDWADALRRDGVPIQVAGTDEKGDRDAADYDFTQPTLLLIGNETSGLSSAWREACDYLIRIPMAKHEPDTDLSNNLARSTVAFTAPDPEPQADVVVAKTAKPTAVLTHGANMRAEPSGSAPVVVALKRGAVVIPGEVRGSWTAVQAGSKHGWVFSSYLDMGGD